jgi:hypothetical protein
MMTGVVSGAFRRIPIICWFCGHFSGYIPELDIIVVNLSLPFGWTGSTVTYSIAGQATKVIHNSHPGFHNLVYCDDHIMFDHSGHFETLVSDISLRRAMVMVLRTTACNEDKSTRWSRRCKALGLIFDLETLTVTMSAPKIAKIVGRLLALTDSSTVSVLQMRETMGLLRYLGTCIPVARPFYNRLQAFLGVLEKVVRPLMLHQAQAEDIRWLLSLFQSDALQNMSLAHLAGAVPSHDRIRVRPGCVRCMAYTAVILRSPEKFKARTDTSFNINYRELLGGYFAVVLWSQLWPKTYGNDAHMRRFMDSTSAV